MGDFSRKNHYVHFIILHGKEPSSIVIYTGTQINSTTVTLDQKVNNLTISREFRPIPRCTVLYKILSKIMTKRLLGVIDDVVDNCQSAFVFRRIINDNIILNHELMQGYDKKGISSGCTMQINSRKPMTLWSRDF